MELIRILNKKNIYSLILAIIIATAVSSTLTFVLQEPATLLSGIDKGQMYGAPSEYPGGPGWQMLYLQPVVLLTLQLVTLEILCRIIVAVKKKK